MINNAAQAADNAPDFSQRIRASLPTMPHWRLANAVLVKGLRARPSAHYRHALFVSIL